MANPPGNHQQEANHASSSFNGVHLSNGNHKPETSCSGVKHNPFVSLDWTLEEQAILEDGLKKRYALEPSIVRYAKIALQLPNKTVRDVALRCRWMTKKENSKRRKEEHNIARKSKDKKERVVNPPAKPHFAAQANISPYAPPMIPMDYDDGISYRAIGGVTGELLEQNAQALNQISANLAAFKIQENIGLLCQTRDNILKIMNELNGIPDIMKQMQVLPVKLNEELANTILPPSSHPMFS